MAHSHDKTLLARLGFADPDKKNGLHDDLCAFLVSPGDHQSKLAELVLARSGELPSSCDKDAPGTRAACGKTLADYNFQVVASSTEVVLAKGHGQYASVVGFLDATCRVEVFAHCPVHGRHLAAIREIAFEAKAGHVPAAELIRQINLYRSVADRRTLWAAFLGFKYSAADVALLRQEKIAVIVAGQRFESWRQERASSMDAGDEL
jgi:hypothetical protein